MDNLRHSAAPASAIASLLVVAAVEDAPSSRLALAAQERPRCAQVIHSRALRVGERKRARLPAPSFASPHGAAAQRGTVTATLVDVEPPPLSPQRMPTV